MQRLTVYSHPLRIIWQEAPIGRLLQGATPVYAKTLISRLFTLCAQAHSRLFTLCAQVRSGAQRSGGFTVVS
ncbi:Putative dehydrogenase protein [Salmonella enterica subsp. enterica serovar Inverness str. R8-3668]|uniref:Putative dehydrogenase protein n=1 Tax=Salmonella enterica subsp. enterica serovar Inverness str. R8-3668 TaxID=913075 RepID=G5ND38_SALET|nr:Putative dehydrogenase protein [Salmonella enterica subsp. enterica serovar Inverness str. R8-3668]